VRLGRVVGTVVATRKDPELEGLKLLLVRACEPDGRPGTEPPVVAADVVGAGVGEVVLYAVGSSARCTLATKDRPVDATIMAIVDLVEATGARGYTKETDGG
jgi:microcompartment protein CcmK/EutM